MEGNNKNLIQKFEIKIKEYENVLFGMNLYIQGMYFMWGHKEEIIKLNQQHYEEAKERMEKSINEAKKTLETVKQHSDKISLLQEFKFPPTEGHPMLDEGTKRYKVLCQAYDELFLNRPKDKPLTKEENSRLLEVAINKM